MGNEVTDDILQTAFKKYHSFAKCKVIRDPVTEKSRGYGFVSLMNVDDYVRAMREMNGKYVGNRPIKMTPSKWTHKSLNKGAGIIKQANAPNLNDDRQEITEFEQFTGTYLTEKYASLIGEKAKEKLDKLFSK